MTEDQTIVRYVINPGIGIARVGNSPDGFFIGPEVRGQRPSSPHQWTAADGTTFHHWKDPEGRVLRQAARFRIYGMNAADEVVQEVVENERVTIRWRVHLANRKAAWYAFLNAMDLGEYAMQEQLRNPDFFGEKRRQLVIDGGTKEISGANRSGPEYHFDDGEFVGTKVYIGELRTDDHGRLLVLAGRGHSASYTNTPATTFASNDGWHDDTADGPVRATVIVDGVEHQAEPSMVACCPPNFGQGLSGVVTMLDVVSDLFSRLGWISLPDRPAFWRDVYPIFERLVRSQAANQGIFFLFGHGSPADLTAPKMLARLADPGPASALQRRSLFEWFKNPNADEFTTTKMPPFYGDTFDDFPRTPHIELALTTTQYAWLERWAEGDFDPDPDPTLVVTQRASLDDYPVSEQPRALDEANLDDILGGPFHPGIELTWPLRLSSMWRAPFRLNILGEDEPVRDDYGPTLSPDVALSAEGPFTASGPGTLTRLMGVPWQTDEASCRSGYAVGTYLPLPAFWSARVPNQTLSRQSYERLLDRKLSVAQRHKHFDHRQDWIRYLGSDYQTEINNMVKNWDKIGILAERPGPDDHLDVDLPATVWIETGLDVHEFHQLSDPSWVELLRAESYDIDRTLLPFLAADDVPAAFGAERHRLADDPEAGEDAAIEHERQLPPERRRRVRRRDE